jgi:alkanesulfonate monooxygenase SsuD/methylene tetrahydromethanopterin reductase-like flavin-dependent oxidoreductase (luciferase family)
VSIETRVAEPRLLEPPRVAGLTIAMKREVVVESLPQSAGHAGYADRGMPQRDRGTDFFTDFPFDDLEEQAGFVDSAESAGYSGVLATENRRDPFLPIAAAARRSRHIRLGTSVTAILARNPFTVAQMAWDLHYNTGEQFILGIGTHQDVHLAARFGINPADKHERLIEAVEAVREIWASWQEDRDPDYAGRHFSARACPPGYRPSTRLASLPPIYHLCSTEADLAVAARAADGIFLHPTWTPEYVTRIVRPAVRAWAPRRQPFAVIDGGIISTGSSFDDLARSRDQARKRIASYWQSDAYDFVYDAIGVIDAIRRFRREYRAGALAWSAGYVDDLFHAFVCEARTGDLCAHLERRSSDLVTGFFPNIVSELPRILPAELVADLRRVGPRLGP